MKKLIVCFFALFILGFVSCSENSSETVNTEISDIRALSGISLIMQKDGCYCIYCNQAQVSFSINNENYEYELKEDKRLESYEGRGI